MIYTQMFDMVNIGLVVLDRDMKVYKWNRWMELHSGIKAEKIIGSSIFDFFPNLNTPSFSRNFKSVMSFGNFSFFSQKLHNYLFPFKPDSSLDSKFEFMQQSCTMGPLRDDKKIVSYVFLSIQDVTEIVTYEQKLYNMSIKDALTGVFNRGFLESRLSEEFERQKRYSNPLSLIILDIDFFKKVNDTYGHQCGDFILKEVTDLLASSIRNVDIFARYGGEEFCCILLETPLKPACLVAERFRKKIMAHDFVYKKDTLKITISLGVADVSPSVKSYEDLLKNADDALYEAKENGRNKVVASKG